MGSGPGAEAGSMSQLCHIDDLPEGGTRGFDVPGQPYKIIVVRLGERVHGWRDFCPHYAGGIGLAWKRDAYLNGARTHIACHAHGAWFEIDTGVCVQGPCIGKRLSRAPLTVDDI
jgi:nitrite reductase/ring-hydroxylating ferredoxin subunit